ncbi:hypothetical protein ACJIZ3_002882 [Penstemon smallii]|uniref:Peroxisomal ATPase PEX1 n=1 Tax=Penstemon smallii TaxID=265156 RepID=A0ABD3U7N6_9LAMI
MEFEVRVIGGIESCFISLPLSLIQTLQSGYLPPILAIELRSDTRLWHVAWCGSASSSSSIEIAQQYADCIGLGNRTVVKVRVVSNLPKATLVTIEPLTEDDWEILELNSELAESDILKQVGIVHEEMRFPLWLHGQTVVTFIVMSTFPQKPVVQLVPGTEVAVAPKRRKNPSIQSSEKEHTITKVLLRVQDSDNRFINKCDQDGVKMDVVFTSGVFLHPETAKKYEFSSLQYVVISPRLLSKETKKKLHSENSATEKVANNGNLTDKQDCHEVVVRILLSESVAKGHIMLSQSLCLFLGTRLHSWVHVKRCNISVKKDIPQVLISPCHFKNFLNNEAIEKSNVEFLNNNENRKRKDLIGRNSSNTGMGISDWSMHEKIVAALSSISSHDGAEETVTKTGDTETKVGYKNSIATLLRMWCLAQLDTIVSNAEEDVNSLVLGGKTLFHLKIRDQKLPRYGKAQTPIYKFPKSRNQVEEPSVDVLYILSLSEESLHDEDINAYELEFDKSSRDKYTSRSLDVLLGKLKLGDILSFHTLHEMSPDNILSAAISSLDWMGAAPSDVNYRLTTLLSPTSGMFFSTYNLPLPGHILIHGPPGSGKTLLAKVSAKSLERCQEILAHIVFVSCSKLTLEKPPSIRHAISSNISEALDHAPSVIIFDDLDSIIAPSSDLEGSQPSSSSAALVEFLADILDEYEEKRRSLCGIGPIAFVATAQSLTSFPQSLSSSGRFDFHVKLPAPAVAERSAILKHETQKRSLQCSDDVLLDIASKCDGYDAYDLEILVNRSVHAAIGRYADLSSGETEKPTLVLDDFLQAMQNFLPVAMRDVTKPSTEGGRSGWADVGGLNDIRNAIEEMIELPSKFPSIFAQAPLRMRSNVLLYGPPGCGKTHIVGAAAAACSLRFISVKGPELLNKYIGASEQAVSCSLFCILYSLH